MGSTCGGGNDPSFSEFTTALNSRSRVYCTYPGGDGLKTWEARRRDDGGRGQSGGDRMDAGIRRAPLAAQETTQGVQRWTWICAEPLQYKLGALEP